MTDAGACLELQEGRVAVVTQHLDGATAPGEGVLDVRLARLAAVRRVDVDGGEARRDASKLQ